ncbi:MAG: 30S ribosomal protein S6 [Phycisphaerae bacterium]|nr:30S ribosomal protein S6 [Phycisphaerae bacterium]
MNTYEAMFLMNPAVHPEWPAAEAEIRRVLERAEAKVLALQKWDERKLAYEIRGQKRGIYGLTYFEAAGDKIGGLERDAQLSEGILRLLVVRADGITAEQIEKVMSQIGQHRVPERGEPGEYGDRPRHGRGEPAPESAAPRAATPARELDTAEAR